MKNHIKTTLLAGACLLASVATAQASPLLINFGSTKVSDWTELTGGSVTSISTTANGYTVTYTAKSSGYVFQTNTYAASTDTTVPSSSSAYDGYDTSLNEMEATLGLTENSITTVVWNTGVHVGNGGGATLTISDCSTSSNTTYTLYILIGSDNAKSVTLASDNYDSASTTIIYDYTDRNRSTGYTTATSATVSIGTDNGYTLIKMTGVTADAKNTITLTLGSYAVISALALVAVPEPSAFGLLAGLGALALVVSRRRRRRVAPAGTVAG